MKVTPLYLILCGKWGGVTNPHFNWFRFLKSWPVIPDTQTLLAPTSGQAFQLLRTAPAADTAGIFRREICAGIRGCADACRGRPDPRVQTVPWDDSGQVSELCRYLRRWRCLPEACRR